MISVVVPVYNSIESLERCVRSLCAQTYTDLEIILVEDSSTDGSDRLCDELILTDPRIRVIHKENKGVSSARNTGMEAASGEYVSFTDSDDFVEPDMLEKLFAALGENDLALCGFHHHYRGRNVVKTPSAAGIDKAELFLSLYGQGFMNMPWNKLFRREKLGRFPEDLSLGEDLLFNIDYLKKADGISVVDEPLCHYIQDDTGKSLSSQKRDDRYVLAKRIWRETASFYEEISGHTDKTGVIDKRFVQDVLDDVESLAADSERTKAQKIKVIADYGKDADFIKASRSPGIYALDYRIVKFCMRHGLYTLTYFLCVVRMWLVRLGAHNG